MERMVAEGVRHALGHDSQESDADVRAVAETLDGLGVGLGALFDDDDALLLAALPLYDALYVLSQVWVLPPEQRRQVPPGPPALRSSYLRQTLRMPTSP
jgi:hypothetical protein